jgi:hypothetical protein
MARRARESRLTWDPSGVHYRIATAGTRKAKAPFVKMWHIGIKARLSLKRSATIDMN